MTAKNINKWSAWIEGILVDGFGRVSWCHFFLYGLVVINLTNVD